MNFTVVLADCTKSLFRLFYHNFIWFQATVVFFVNYHCKFKIEFIKKQKKLNRFSYNWPEFNFFKNVALGHEVVVEFDSWFKNQKISLPVGSKINFFGDFSNIYNFALSLKKNLFFGSVPNWPECPPCKTIHPFAKLQDPLVTKG